jgi:coenzyme F420-0:L-glutamate ligase / coenzyme F420-1:gamma-L-glutamate ligase
MADLDQTILGRRSVRRYLDRPIAREVIDQLLSAAMWAPSAHNRQMWRWAVVVAPDAKAWLARTMGERLRADRLADGESPEAVETGLARAYTRLTTAPALIAACSTMAGVEEPPGSRVWRAKSAMAMQSVAAAVENLLLAAHAAGLGACWLCAPLFCPKAVQQALDLPLDWEAQALITLGYPADAPAPAPRRPPAETVVYR